MNLRLKHALHALAGLDRSLKPVQLARAREDALVEALHGLAAEFGREIAFTRIDANGEMDFNLVDVGQGYGPELAALLSKVPRRYGVAPTDAAVLPENGWCRIHHFDVERLLSMLDDCLPAADASETESPKFG